MKRVSIHMLRLENIAKSYLADDSKVEDLRVISIELAHALGVRLYLLSPLMMGV